MPERAVHLLAVVALNVKVLRVMSMVPEHVEHIGFDDALFVGSDVRTLALELVGWHLDAATIVDNFDFTD